MAKIMLVTLTKIRRKKVERVLFHVFELYVPVAANSSPSRRRYYFKHNSHSVIHHM